MSNITDAAGAILSPARITAPAATPAAEHTPETRAALYHGVYIFTLTFVLSAMAIVAAALLGLDLFDLRS